MTQLDLFTSESVSEGHREKVVSSYQIASAIPLYPETEEAAKYQEVQFLSVNPAEGLAAADNQKPEVNYG